MTPARLAQWRAFQPPTTRDSAPIAFLLFLGAGLALAGAVLVLTIGAWL